jgi:hypothetical protein
MMRHLEALLGSENAELARFRPFSNACAPCARTSCPTSWKNSCTTSPPSAPRPGTGCSTRPWPGCRISRSRARTTPLALEATLNLLTDPDRARREAAARALAEVFRGQPYRLFARVHNTLAKEKEIEDRWRKMPNPQHARHLANHVEPEVVQALRDAVVAAYPRLSHRYYALKARWLGLDKLQVWDRNAPLPLEPRARSAGTRPATR